MKFLTRSLVALSLVTSSAIAEPLPLNVGEQFNLHSKYLDSNMVLKVYLPDGYGESKEVYPVIYVLDGKRYAKMASGMQESLSHFTRMPKAIVVGVNFTTVDEPQRRAWLSRQSKAFLDYMQHEVVTLIDKRYRTNDDRIIFGWQLAGNVALKALARRPGLFDGYISSSISYMVESDSPSQLIKEYLDAKGNSQPQYVYHAMAESERWIETDVKAANQFIAKQPNQYLTFDVEFLAGEDHWSSSHLTLYRGLRAYYKDYEPLNFRNLEEVKAAGDLEAVQAHYAKRAKRYGAENKVLSSTQFAMLMSAYKAKDFESFDRYMSVFDDFIDTTPLARWGHLYGQFYLQHKQVDKALALFNKNRARFPNVAIVEADIGDVYKAKGDNATARKHYQKAVKLAEDKKDAKLGDYQAKLKAL